MTCTTGAATPSFPLLHFPPSIPPLSAAPAPVLVVVILRQPLTTVVADLTLTLLPVAILSPSPLLSSQAPSLTTTALAAPLVSCHRRDQHCQPAPSGETPPPYWSFFPPLSFFFPYFSLSRALPTCLTDPCLVQSPAMRHHCRWSVVAQARLSPSPSPYPTCMHSLTLAPRQTDPMSPIGHCLGQMPSSRPSHVP